MNVSSDDAMSCQVGCFPVNSANLLVQKAFADAEAAGMSVASVDVKAHCPGQLGVMICGKICGMTADITFGIEDGEDQTVRASFEGPKGTIVVADITDVP